MSQFTEEEKEMVVMFACTALPGVIITMGGSNFPNETAEKAFNIAEAMVRECKKRTETEND